VVVERIVDWNVVDDDGDVVGLDDEMVVDVVTTVDEVVVVTVLVVVEVEAIEVVTDDVPVGVEDEVEKKVEGEELEM